MAALWPMQVPFGKSFRSSLQWYARADSPGRCSLRVSCQVDFTGFVGPLKGLIHRSSMEVSLASALSPPGRWECLSTATQYCQWGGSQPMQSE